MPVIVAKPTTSGQRKLSHLKNPVFGRTLPKALRLATKQQAGRNNQGKITIRHRGGGEKRFLRLIDWKRDKQLQATVQELQYDPGRTANVALLQYEDGERRYILAPAGLNVGDQVMSGAAAPIRPGNHLPLKRIPVGSLIHNVSLAPERPATTVRSAGEAASLLSLEETTAHVKLPSGEVRRLDNNCQATLGVVSNSDWQHVRIGKAGRNRHFGWRPTVRGKAMNPVDHPHGGGEGNTSVGMKYPKTPWGAHALGVKTRGRHKSSESQIIRRRKTR